MRFLIYALLMARQDTIARGQIALALGCLGLLLCTRGIGVDAQTLLTLAQQLLTSLMLLMEVGKLALDTVHSELNVTSLAMHAHEKIQLTELLSFAGVSPREADYLSSCLVTLAALVAGTLAACDHDVSPRQFLDALRKHINAGLLTIVRDGPPPVPRMNSRAHSWLSMTAQTRDNPQHLHQGPSGYARPHIMVGWRRVARSGNGIRSPTCSR